MALLHTTNVQFFLEHESARLAAIKRLEAASTHTTAHIPVPLSIGAPWESVASHWDSSNPWASSSALISPAKQFHYWG